MEYLELISEQAQLIQLVSSVCFAEDSGMSSTTPSILILLLMLPLSVDDCIF